MLKEYYYNLKVLDNMDPERGQGGMYKILKVVVEMEKEKKETQEFKAKDVIERADLSVQACSNNLKRLVKAGFLEQKKENKGHGWEVTYRIKEARYEFIRDYLYS